MTAHGRLSLAVFVPLAAAVAACSSRDPGPPVSPAGVELQSTLRAPHEVVLNWKDHGPEPAGRIVEFATEPDGQFTTLDHLPPRETTFTHPRLIPDTNFYYRVRPYYGPASAPIEIQLPDPPPGEDIEKDPHEWAPPKTRPEANQSSQRIRGEGAPPTAATSDPSSPAAPARFEGKVMHSQGVLFTWVDRAVDEEAYVIEVRPEGRPDFRVAALLDPNSNSFGLITLPEEKRAAFRVRAIYYGKPSNLEHEKTGPEPPAMPPLVPTP